MLSRLRKWLSCIINTLVLEYLKMMNDAHLMSCRFLLVSDVGDMLAFSFKAFSIEADLAKRLLQFQPEHEEDEGKPKKASDDKVDPTVANDDDDDNYGAEKP
jgi:hypothetical protein